MAYEAMARRYRPRTFDDVVGQEHVAQTLKNAILTERVAHAYLFCGPHGCGKTSMARIFACSLVCQKGPTSEPCGECDICNDVLRGQDMDVQEIDGASNNGVEQVRALREQAGYIPSRARYKIYIIDEVHMLSTAAFNALLKTLEEPPAHVKFILATTDPHKILGTILSRCQRFDFRLVPPPKMSEFFRKLIACENAEITDEALDAVAAFSGGSVRDGLVLLDQLVSYSQGKVTREDVERVRGVAGAEAVAGIYEAILAHRVADALKIVDEVARKGTNTGDFLDQLIEYGRDVMLVVATGEDQGVSAYGPARRVLLDIANAISLDQALLMLDVFAQARTRVRSRALSNTLVPLEMAVARLAGLESLEPISDIIKKVDAYSRGAPLPEPTQHIAAPSAPVVAAAPEVVAPAQTQPQVSTPPQASQATVPTPQPVQAPEPVVQPVENNNDNQNIQQAPVEAQGGDVNEVAEPAANVGSEAPGAPVTPPWEDKAASGADENIAPAAQEIPQEIAPASTDISQQPAPAQSMDKESVWQRVTALLSQQSPADNSLLADVYIDRIEDNSVYLSVPGGGSFIFEQLEDKHRKGRLAGCASQVLGREVSVHLTLREAITPTNERAEQRKDTARAREQAEHDSGVRLILQAFDATIKNIEEKR